MAAEILTLDAISDASIWRDQQGYHGTRKAIVKTLDNAVGHLRMADALAVSGMPQYGEPLIGVPYPFYSVVASVTATPLSTTAAEVSISYEPIGIAGVTDTQVGEAVGADTMGGGRVSIRTGLQQVTRNTDPDGKMIILRHNALRYKADVMGRDPANLDNEMILHHAGALIEQVGEVQDFIPIVVLVFERREPRDPRAKAMRFVGHVDPARIFGDPSRSWKCTRMDGVSTDGKQSYLVTYEFQRSVEERGLPPHHEPTSGWDPIVSVYDHENNTFFADPVSENEAPADGVVGIRQLKYAPEADFEELQLRIP